VSTHPDRRLDVGNAMIAWLKPLYAGYGMGLVTFDWQKSVAPMPTYPARPRTQCPRIRLRAYTKTLPQDMKVAAGGTQAPAQYTFSLWIQLSQTPGQAQQELLIAQLSLMERPFLEAAFFPDQLQSPAVPGFQLHDALTTQTVVRNEMQHRFKDPQLTVSCGEMVVTLKGRTFAV
jgi:hypothetical protein